MGTNFVQKSAFILYLTLYHASDEIFLSRDRVHEKNLIHAFSNCISTKQA